MAKTDPYEGKAETYARHRRTDPRIAASVLAALAGAESVVNVGAGAGSYEPTGCQLLAVEPSPSMRAMRPRDSPPAIDASAESLPFDDDAVDAALAVLTLHHWSDPRKGLREMRRVARGPVVILTFDPHVKRDYWLLSDYLPETAEHDQQIFPSPGDIAAVLGGGRIEPVPIHADCRDGFFEAFYSRPEAYLDADVRRAQSGWAWLSDGIEERAVSALAADLDSGRWDRRHGELRAQPSYDGGLRLIVSPGEDPRRGTRRVR